MGITHNLPRAIQKDVASGVRPSKFNILSIVQTQEAPSQDFRLRSNQIDVGLKSTRNNIRSNCVLLSGILLRIETASPLEMISNMARTLSIVSDFGRIRGLFCGPNGGASSQAAILVLDINCRMPCISTLKYNKVIIASIRCGFSRKRVEASRGVFSTLKLFSTLC